ncbi:MerR family transcriptional regulator [bacterium]|nr:MerR family transcriptional regulator [bacterium]
MASRDRTSDEQASFCGMTAKHTTTGTQNPLEPTLAISEAARATGLSESALRKYEAAGLIHYHRTSGGYRMLSEEDLERIRLIQHLIKKKGLNLEGIKRLWSLLPCWELKGCNAEAQADCPIMQGAMEPCWVIFKNEGCCDEKECRTCEVYRLAAHCTEDLKRLVFSLKTGNGNIGEILRERAGLDADTDERTQQR